ncbi:hypothetical protein KCP69_03440 [Salmonella enterica subsp. enterica]|nr:hypothetical protein KCP69_03440 [Salmonella enterica subsp. enterica]
MWRVCISEEHDQHSGLNHSYIAYRHLLVTAIQISLPIPRRVVLGYRLPHLPPPLYDSGLCATAQYGTLPVVGWSMSFGGLILLPLQKKVHFAVSGSLILAFFTGGDRALSLTFSLYFSERRNRQAPKPAFCCAEPLSSAPAVATAGD